MTDYLSYYCKRFSKIRVSKSSGFAPNKPVLLLSIIELIERGKIQENKVFLSADLISAFMKWWKYLGQNRKPDIGLPFYHLTSDTFWHHKPKPGFKKISRSKSFKPRSVSALHESVEYGYFDEPLYNLLLSADSRTLLFKTLVSRWFSNNIAEVEEVLKVDALQELQEKLMATGGKIYTPEELEDKQEEIIRDAAFRHNVVLLYEHRCVFCELQIFTSQEENIVDGAHIKPFSKFYDDNYNNGLCFCKNHHWAFDRYWFTLADDYTIIVSKGLREDSPNSTPISSFAGKRIILPNEEEHYPRLDAIAWHREQFMKKRA